MRRLWRPSTRRFARACAALPPTRPTAPSRASRAAQAGSFVARAIPPRPIGSRPRGPTGFPSPPPCPCHGPHPSVPSDTVDESDALKALSAAVAAATGKPETYVLVTLRTGAPVLFGGTEAPAAYGELLSIGAIGGDKNKKISAALAGVLTAKLGVDASRFYLSARLRRGGGTGRGRGSVPRPASSSTRQRRPPPR